MPKRTSKLATARLRNQDEIPTVRPPQSGWHSRGLENVRKLRIPPHDGLWQLVSDVMRAEAEEALWGTRR
jgi:hypothetical protein